MGGKQSNQVTIKTFIDVKKRIRRVITQRLNNTKTSVVTAVTRMTAEGG
jgi:hypothetical protein